MEEIVIPEGFPEECTQKAFAELVGIDQTRMSRICRQGVIPMRGRWVLVREAVEAFKRYREASLARYSRVTRIKEGDPPAKKSAAQAYLEAKLKERQYKAKLVELQYKEKRKELLPVSMVEEIYLNNIAMCRERLLALPLKMAVELEHKEAREVEELLNREVYKILEALEHAQE